MKTLEYLAGPEDLRRRELVFGVVREPPAPRYTHQAVVTRLTTLLAQHVHEHKLGMVCVSPIDVVLDEEKALILQPDVLFIRTERMEIVRDQVWGAPDLVVEVASLGTKRYDSTTKIDWYGTYGVRECWLVDAQACALTVVNFERERATHSFVGTKRIASTVLPDFCLPANQCFFWPL